MAEQFNRGDRVEETYYGYGQGIVAFFNGEEIEGRTFKTSLAEGVYVEFDNHSIGGTWIEGEYLRRLEREQ